MKLPICILMLFSMLFFNSTAQAQVPTKTATGALECEVVLDIYDGFYDWVSGTSYSGSGSPKAPTEKVNPGAVTVANLNDTNGNGMGIGNAGVDLGETNVTATANGRNEIDLMKMVLRKKDPAAGLVGSVTLSKVSGAVKLWNSATKGSEISISSPITIPISQLPKTYYIEATQASGSLQDIEFLATFNGKEDRVNATAVWVEKNGHWTSGSSTPGNMGGIVTFGINEGLAKNGSKFGSGEFRKKAISWDSDPNKDKKIGGRILMGWTVYPANADAVASFDVTRQRKTRTWKLKYTEQNFVPSATGNMNFPFQADTEPADANFGEDVEEPNDDGISNEDRMPINNTLYSYDAPSTWQTFNANGVSEDLLAFKVSKNWFKEFVRVRAKKSSFNIVDNALQGSRASEKFDWHCTYYTNKDGDFELGVDNSNVNFAETKIFRNGNDVANQNLYTTAVTVTNGVSYEVGDFSFIYLGLNNDGKKELWVTRLGPDGLIANEEDLIIEPTETTWNISMDGVNATLEQITGDNDMTFFLLSTFKTNASGKDNLLNPGSYNNFTR